MVMKVRVILVSLLIIITISFIQSTKAEDVEWDYGNYLSCLDIISFDDPVTAGGMASISVEVGANTDVVLHVEFKGEFAWGHWVFYSKEVFIGQGVSSVTESVSVPFKTLIEPASDFYYYVYVTFPLESWSSSAWGLAQSVSISAPGEIGHEGLVALMSHLKWLVKMSQLPEGTKTSLMSKLEAAGSLIDSAFLSGDLGKLTGALGSLNAFLNELDSDVLKSYPDSKIWKDQCCVLIGLVEVYV